MKYPRFCVKSVVFGDRGLRWASQWIESGIGYWELTHAGALKACAVAEPRPL